MSNPERFCAPDEIWVCHACGKFREHDLHAFDDEACVLNAVVHKRLDVIIWHGRVSFK